MSVDSNPELFSQVSSILRKKDISPPDFDFLKSLSPSTFQSIIEQFPPESSSKILDYLQRDYMKKPKEKPKEKPPPSLNTSHWENFYAKGMFKHLWLEDVKKIHKTILPNFQTNEFLQKEENLPKEFHAKNTEFPNKLSLQFLEKKPNFIEILAKMIYVFGEFRQDNFRAAEKLLEILKKTLEILFDRNVLSKILNQKPKKKQKKLLKKQLFHDYLTHLFPKEYKKFSEVKEASKKLFSAEILSELEENESQETFPLIPDKNQEKSNLEFEFVNARIDSMNQQEFLQFSYCRSLNFLSLGRDAFLELIDFKAWHEAFLSEVKIPQLFYEIEFLNYVFCRICKEIIEKCIKKMNNGALVSIKNSIPIDKIEEEGDFQLKGLKLKVKKYLQQKVSIEEFAYKLFVKEFWVFEYEKILEVFNTKIKLSNNKGDFAINNEEIKENSIDIHLLWSKMKSYQKYWFQRIIAERQVKALLNKSENNLEKIDFLNEYAVVLYERLKGKRDMDLGYVFKEWFLLKIQGANREKNLGSSGVGKRLESIFD